LLDAEPHHQREEQALFPELERRGVTGPPRIMRLEHVELRQRKHALQELAQAAETMPYADFKERLNEVTTYLVFNLRDHIFKEDNILYPTAAQTIGTLPPGRLSRRAATRSVIAVSRHRPY
jgi:DUF438 domain-containing protein